MQTLEKIEAEVKQLSKAEQEALRDWLENMLEDELEFTDEFKAKIERAKCDIAEGRGLRSGTRQNHLSRFFADWDASHSVTVGEQPTRTRTYADNSRLR
jgi:hypothetical protein